MAETRGRIIVPSPAPILPPWQQSRVEPHGRNKIQALWKGYRFRAVGRTVVWGPPKETFDEFLVRLLKHELGKDWYFSELNEEPSNRHQTMKWIIAYHDFSEAMATDENRDGEGGWSAPPSGDVASLLWLAYDVYQCKHSLNLLPDIVRRLKKRHEFQGARYELAVAAVLSRAGSDSQQFKLIPAEPNPSGKRCEFVAVHEPSGVRLAVEAKSRRRSGVFHEAGTLDLERALRGDVAGLMSAALEQCPADLPSAVFIDLNSPPESISPEPSWFPDVMRMMERMGRPTPEQPDSFNALFLTNTAMHYAGSQRAPLPQTFAAFPLHPRHSYPAGLMSLIYRAVETIARIPDERF